MKINPVDLAVTAAILWELLMGLRRGLSGELFRLAGTCLVFAIGLRFYEDFGLMIANHSRLAENQEIAVALAFLLILVGMGICFFILRIVLAILVNVKFNETIDRPAGGVAGILNGGLIAALLVFAAGLWPNTELQPLITVDSYAGKTVFQIVPVIKEKIRSLPIRFQKPSNQPEPEPHKDSRRSAGRRMPRQDCTAVPHDPGSTGDGYAEARDGKPEIRSQKSEVRDQPEVRSQDSE